jgi:DNA (cytosine-5)-methyltransferase 1
MVKPTVISTFAGCGGSSLGYQMAGFHELLAVEWDQNAVDTFRLNFPDVPVYHGDIAKLTGDECMRLAGIEKGALDVLDGSPPCQGFSTAGKRKFNDPRNSLFKEYARLLSELQPKVFVMENVTGMVKGCMKQAYLQIIKTLRECGYKAKGEVMNAMYFNVPQSRERVIIIGVREDIGIEPSHPKPQGKPTPINKVLPIQALDYDTKGQFSEFNIDVTRKPFPTITKSNRHHFFADFGEGKRKLTIKEIQKVASFPDGFIFTGGDSDSWERIGNSVPPNLMKAIAEHIKINILSNTNKHSLQFPTVRELKEVKWLAK